MEQATSPSTWLAYGLIVLFVLALLYFFLRTMAMMSLLLLQPAREVWDWLKSLGRGKESP